MNSPRITAGLIIGACIALTVSTGRAIADGGVRNILTDLYGGDGIRLSQASGFGHDAHFTVGTFSGLGQMGDSIASNATSFFTAPSPVVGFELDLETGIPVQSTKTFGPLMGATAGTLGEGKLDFGFSFHRVEFTHFEGRKLSELQVTVNHPDVNGDGLLAPFQPFPGGPTLDAELDQVRIDIDLDVTQNIFAIFTSYGLSDDWDIGVVLPIIEIQASARAKAGVVDPTPGTASPHFFDPANGDSPVSQVARSALGIGDLVLRTKYRFLKNHDALPDLALGGRITAPTGNERDLMGTGETKLQGLLIMSKTFDQLTPHLNLGYEWVPGDSSVDNVRFIAGFDTAINQCLTLSADILGRWEHHGDGIGDTLIDGGLGIKVEIAEDLLLNASVQTPLNIDEGVRAQLIWAVGIEHTF